MLAAGAEELELAAAVDELLELAVDVLAGASGTGGL